MADEDINNALVVMSGAVLVMAEAARLKKKRRERRWWETTLYGKRRGNELMSDLKSQHISGQYKNFTRMSPTDFETLLEKIGARISKQNTQLRESISAQDRLAVTLRFLATGDSFSSLGYGFRVSKQSISQIIPEVCLALLDELKQFVKLPKTPDSWMEVSNVFEKVWNLPHCLGALDGKHIMLQAPISSGTEYFNYKGFFSIVLLALVDGNYNFLFVDVGCQGRISDGGVFKNTKLYNMLEEKTLGLPQPKPLPGRTLPIPYFFAADSAFSLEENIMKPYSGNYEKGDPKRAFNYRLSRGRRVVENAFGILSAVFRVLRKPILLEPETAQIIVLTTVHLHNYLRRNSEHYYTPPGSLDVEKDGVLQKGSWRKDTSTTTMIPLAKVPRRPNNYVKNLRDEIADYVVKEGAVRWQDSYA